MILISKVLHNANPSYFPTATLPIPIPIRRSQIQSSLVGRNENENGAASYSTIRRLILVPLLTCPAWTIYFMRRSIKALTCIQVDGIDWNQRVRTNTSNQKTFHRIVIIALPCTQRTNRLPQEQPRQSRQTGDLISINPSQTRTNSNDRNHHLNRHSFYLPSIEPFSRAPFLCAQAEPIF